MFHKFISWLIVGVTVLGLWGLSCNYAYSRDSVMSLVRAQQAHTIYLPLALNGFPREATQFGGEFTGGDDETVALAAQAQMYWARVHALDWDRIEPNPPVNGVHTYDWSKVPEDFLRQLSANRMQVIAIVKKAPSWAQQSPGVDCGPIAPDALDDFAVFMRAVVQRYSKAPYHIRYWELGNEPDVDPSLVPGDSVFGCWGDVNDAYYGGGYYGEMLKTVTPAIKAADPNAIVLNGGLLLDCDPENPPVEKNCDAALFFEGMLRAGAGNSFDMVSFHGYPPYTSDGRVQDEDFPNWAARGGVVMGKVAYLREVMARYGVQKPLIHTEGAIICPEWNIAHCNPPNGAFHQAQAEYVPRLYLRNWANDIAGTIWYTFNGNGWRYSGMVGASTASPKPAYRAFAFLTQKLAGADYLDEVKTYADVTIYRFQLKNGNVLWAVWSNNGSTQTISLPGGWVSGYDLYGTPFDAAGSLDVTAPVYLEVHP